MKNNENLIGRKFNRLSVIEFAGYKICKNGNRLSQWLCKCDCGNITTVTTYSLTNGKTKSCGCLNKEIVSNRSRKYNTYKFIDDYVIVYNDSNYCYVDLDDYDKIKDIYWYKNKLGYFSGWYQSKLVALHRFIMDCPDNMVVDHIGGTETKYDNRKKNLRIVTQQQNTMNCRISKNNTTGITGVYWHKSANKWTANIKVNRKSIYLGIFDTKEEAIAARKKAEEKYFGEYSYDNSQQNSYLYLTEEINETE